MTKYLAVRNVKIGSRLLGTGVDISGGNYGALASESLALCKHRGTL